MAPGQTSPQAPASPPTRSDQTTVTLALEDRAFIRQLVDELIHTSLVLADDWQALPEAARDYVYSAIDQNDLIDRLVQQNMLTDYQSSRIKAGTIYGLVLGNYRVLDRVGAGGMGIVFRAEHLLLRRIVAVKVLPLSRDQDPRVLRRFLTEMRTVASLQHPNIVAATDAGQIFPSEPNLPILHYLVMEFVNGRDLEDIVTRDGPMGISLVCDLIHQVAGALSEANSQNLVHRDIKPSNILLNGKNQAKLLDFGLARELGHNLTEPGSLLGTIDYMSPEQTQDPSSVDIRADIYGLGATLYWCLTQKVPFPTQNTLSQQIARRLREPPPSVRVRRPEVSPELDAVVMKMMAIRADDRHQTPQAVMRALLPFIRDSRNAVVPTTPNVADTVWELADAELSGAANTRILIVDDEPGIVSYCKAILHDSKAVCDAAASAEEALDALTRNTYDLILLDVVLPGQSGFELLQKMRERPACQNIRAIMMSGSVSADDLAQMLALGADDYLTKPFGAFQLRARVDGALRLGAAVRRVDSLSAHVRAVTHDLERQLEARQDELRQSRQALVQGLIAVVRHRTGFGNSHLVRKQHYCRALAEAAASHPDFEPIIDRQFVQSLEYFAPLYDLGMIALPDHILHKSGALDPQERIIMQSHTTMGADLLQRVAESMGPAGDFLAMAKDLAQFHHEQFNGKGYPDRLAGDEIPLSARIMAIADSYDALRNRRNYQPVLPHDSACELILEASPGKYDPRLLEAFKACAAKFDGIFQQITD
ncbi:MAG: protein kinase domain-containing protein [Gemmataceae bacterium]